MGALAVRHDPRSAALVRHALADDLAARGVAAERIDDVLLVASELIGNAVQHAGADADGALAVDWQLHGCSIMLNVHDASLELPIRRNAGITAPSGRGLMIVTALSEDWGVQHTLTGKRVWARIRID